MTPAQRAQAIADQCATRIERQIARSHWTVTKPGAEPMLVVFNPEQTQAEVLTRWYPGCGAVPL